QGETGFLVKPGDPGELAEAITRFYNLQSRDHLREGIRTFRKKFTWGSVVERTMELYTDILKQGNNEHTH
ncbi:MAG: glycosyl transferase family 1, partial [Acidobacteriota bacterium]